MDIVNSLASRVLSEGVTSPGTGENVPIIDAIGNSNSVATTKDGTQARTPGDGVMRVELLSHLTISLVTASTRFWYSCPPTEYINTASRNPEEETTGSASQEAGAAATRKAIQ